MTILFMSMWFCTYNLANLGKQNMAKHKCNERVYNSYLMNDRFDSDLYHRFDKPKSLEFRSSIQAHAFFEHFLLN